MCPAGRPKSFDQTAALEAAMAVFWAKGYEAASIAELVTAMGIGRQSLYDTFGDKRTLYLTALRHYGERAVASTLDALTGPGEPIDRIRSVFDHWAEAQACPDCKGCFMAGALAQLDRNDAEVCALVDELQQSLIDAFASAVAQAQSAQQLRDDIDPAELAVMLTAVGHGLALAGRAPSNATTVPAGVRATLALLGIPVPTV
ncbi:MAG: TetR/AcrR family transcriptional regulator [Planctomycetota bacterium]